MVFSLKGAVKLRKLCNVAFSGASANKPSSAQVKRTLRCAWYFPACSFPFLKQEDRDHFH